MKFVSDHRAALIYIILVLIVGFSFLRVEAAHDALRQKTTERTIALCEKDNEMKLLLSTMLREIFIQQEIDLETGVDEAELLERQHRIDLLEHGLLAPEDCDRFIQEIQ